MKTYTQLKTKGGKRPNAGAPKKLNPAKSRTMRLTDEQWEKFKLLGGANWLRFILGNEKNDK